MTRRPLLCLLLVTLLALPGCAADPREGYAWTSAHRSDIDTIAVPMFENATYVPDLEAQLTEALIKEIHRSTPWRVAEEQHAQTILTGAIRGADMRVFSTDPDSGLVQELGRTLTVSFEWRRADTGEVLVARRRFKAGESFVPARGARERLEEGDRRAISELAREIVAELRSSW